MPATIITRISARRATDTDYNCTELRVVRSSHLTYGVQTDKQTHKLIDITDDPTHASATATAGKANNTLIFTLLHVTDIWHTVLYTKIIAVNTYITKAIF